jgi:hypothetical protein
MISFIEGTLLISNILLIFFSLIYGFLIVKRKKKEESSIWVYFLIASGIFFLSEMLTLLNELFRMDVGIIKALLRISFGVVILFAFLSKYSTMETHHRKKHN